MSHSRHSQTTRLTEGVHSLGQALKNILFPSLCLACQEFTRSEEPLCDACKQQLRPCGFFRLRHRFAVSRHIRLPMILYYACYTYTQPLKEILHHFKYNVHYRYLSGFLSRLMLNNVFPQRRLFNDYQLLSCVPMHPTKLREREFNHARVLAEILGTAFHISLTHDLLAVSRLYPLQSHLPAKERTRNPLNTFKLNPKAADASQGKNIILIDDVLTTGSTVNACIQELLPLRPEKILVLTLAKA